MTTKATPKQRAAYLGGRIAQALKHARRTPDDLAEQTGIGRRKLDRMVMGKTEPFFHELVRIAWFCMVDPRWLATGIGSPAAQRALEALAVRGIPPAAMSPDLRRTLELLTQPVLVVGRCRYCGCSHFEPCPECCEWVDDDETICSACLDPDSDFNQENSA